MLVFSCGTRKVVTSLVARSSSGELLMPIAPSPAVLRACDVLGHLAAYPTESFSVSELARSVGAPRATCDAVLPALMQRGLVYRSADRRYSLGPTCRSLGDAAESAAAPLVAVEPVAKALARTTSSCVAISSCTHGSTRVDRVFDHAGAFAIRPRVGESAPLIPPFGAVFVAWDDTAIGTWLDRAGASIDEAERDYARAALAALRERGFAISTIAVRPELVRLLEDLADRVPDHTTIDRRDSLIRELAPSRYLTLELASDRPQRVIQMSAPVFDATGAVVFSLMILGQSYELEPDEIGELTRHLVDAARDATARLDGRWP